LRYGAKCKLWSSLKAISCGSLNTIHYRLSLSRYIITVLDRGMNTWYNIYMETTIGIMGQKIRQLRLDDRLTLEEAAERAGCTPGFLSQVERNQAVPSISMLYSIAQALGVKVTHFFPRMTSGPKVVRADAREVFRFEGSFMVYSLLSTSFPDRKLGMVHRSLK